MTSGASTTLPPLSCLAAASLGGAVGALARWSLTVVAPTPVGHFPWTVLAINVVGAGLLAALPLVGAARRRPWLAVLLGTGVLGGFTTMSTASTDTVVLVDSGHPGLAAAYCLGTLGAAVLAVVVVRRMVAPADDARLRDEEGEP